MAVTPDGSVVGISCEPSQEYLGGVSVVGTPYSVGSVMVEASSFAVSDSKLRISLAPYSNV